MGCAAGSGSCGCVGVAGRAHSDLASVSAVTGSAAAGIPAAAPGSVGWSEAGSGSNSTLSSGRSWGSRSVSVISGAMVHGHYASGWAYEWPSAMTSPNPAPSGRARASIVHSAASLSGRQRSKRAAWRSRPPVI